MTGTVPETGPAFEAMMKEIDAGLARDAVPIHARPIRAIMAVGDRFKIPMPLASSRAGLPPEVARNAPLSERIVAWYDRVYGERIKADFSPGSMVVAIEGDLYVLRLPRLYGRAEFIASREFVARPRVFARQAAVCNVLQLVQNLTEVKAAALSDQALHNVLDMFALGFEAHDLLEASQGYELIRIARGDVQTAVNNLMDPGNRFGESKWASLQAAEKTLKAAIALEGGKFKNTHDLSELCKYLDKLGFKWPWKELVEQIQCWPGIRYGAESCTRDQALSAHHASLRLVVALGNAGVRFKRLLRGGSRG